MKKIITLSSKQLQFYTFLIKKSRNEKMGLWFVMVFPGLGNRNIFSPVWRKIEENGLPKNLGYDGSFILCGDIKLLGLEGAGPNEMAYIEKIRKQGTIKFMLSLNTCSKEDMFRWLLSAEADGP
jgi:hypothetical protein